MVCPYWVGHFCVTSAHFGSAACSGLWLVQVDCISLTAVLILDMSGDIGVFKNDSVFYCLGVTYFCFSPRRIHHDIP